MTELDSQSGGLGSTPAPLPTNFFFFCSWFGRVEILGHYSKSPTGCLQPFVVVVFFLSCYVVFELFVSNYNYVRNSCNYRSGIYSNKRHGTY